MDGVVVFVGWIVLLLVTRFGVTVGVVVIFCVIVLVGAVLVSWMTVLLVGSRAEVVRSEVGGLVEVKIVIEGVD